MGTIPTMLGLPVFLACLAAVLAGCGDGQGARGTAGGSSAGGESPPERAAYADSSMTPFAVAMTDLAMAAVAEAPLPAAPFPLEPASDNARVRIAEGVAPRGSLGPVAFLFRADFAIVTDSEEAPTWLRLSALLTRHGLRILELSPRRLGADAPSRPVAALGSLSALFVEALEIAQTGSVSGTLPEADVALLGDASVTEALNLLVQGAAPLPDGVAGGTPVRARLGDLAILARDEAGELYLLEMGVTTGEHGFRLRASPLVTVVPLARGR